MKSEPASGEAWYTRRVLRALLSFLFAVLFVGLTCADPLVCPDGCADDEASAHAPISSGPAGATGAAAASCALCQGLHLTVALPERSPLQPREPAAPPLALPLSSSHLPSIDHPPRLA